MKVGIIGVGGIARLTHISDLLSIGQEIVALCDINPKKLEDAEELVGHPVNTYLDYNEMLADEEIEAVHICTPNYTHAPLSIAALKAGKHVLCEKPDSISVEDALAMQQAERESGKVLCCIRNNRFTPTGKFLKKFADKNGTFYAGRCGWQRVRGIPGKGGWFTTKEKSGGGPLIDLGVHMIDLAIYLMGNPTPVAVSGCTYTKFTDSELSNSVHSMFGDRQENGTFDVEDLAMGFIRFDNGACLQIEFSWASNVEEELVYVELRGEKAGIYLRNGVAKLITEQDGAMVSMHPETDGGDGHKNCFKHFYNVLQGKEERILTMEQGVNMIKILMAIYESAKTGKEVLL
ncbi:MAG: Gfo/Idh/MocA family oxidoreductase [Clostridia bacterium]|nr:Gfo/Idh/MocA family oxidoreductase [Clostridia bacterium]